jgi:hypothetical protein
MPAPVHIGSLGFVVQGQRGPAELVGLAPDSPWSSSITLRIAF